MLSPLLYVVVATVTLAVGRNLFRTARKTARLESELLESGDRYRSLRTWNYRFGGVVLMALGVFLAVGGVVSAWRLVGG